MSECIRYQNPEICDYLASQYVAGHMTTRVRARTEALAQSIPALSDAISRWADSFTPLQQVLYEASPQYTAKASDGSSRVWPLIEQRVTQLTAEKNTLATSTASNQSVIYRLWNTLLLWRVMAGATTLASVFMVSVLWFAVSPTPTATGPSYLAAMSSHGMTGQPADFVISVYAKKAHSPSRLHIQWTKERQATLQPLLHLWAENKETGAIEYIGIQDLNVGSVPLTKPSWMAIANSSRLFMTENKMQPSQDNIVFSGLCLQLQQWES